MVRRARQAVCAATIAGIVAMSLSVALVFHLRQGHLASLSCRAVMPSGERNLCGAYALFVAANRMGVAWSFFDITKALGPAEEGVAFGRIAQCARERGFYAKLRRLSWKDLKETEFPVVLWADGNHYLTVDPREHQADTPEVLRVYEQNRPATWYSRLQLESRWAGESLVLRHDPAKPRTGAPCLRWQACLQDCGFVAHDQSKVDFIYDFENAGGQPLNLSVLGTGCGCAKASVAPLTVAPGGKGKATLTVDVFDKRGYFSTFALLKTNDPLLPQCKVNAIGGVFQPVLTSLDQVYFGELSRGSSVVQSFYIQDRGDRTLKIDSLHASVDTSSGPKVGIGSAATITEIERSNYPSHPISRYPVKIGDYRVDLTLTIAPTAPLGPVAGEVVFQTNQPGKFRAGKVLFNGLVRSDVYAEPSALLLSTSQPSITIRLKSRLGKRVEMAANPAVSGDTHLSIVQVDRDDTSLTYRVSLDDTQQGGTLSATLTFNLKGEGNICVPVVVHYEKQRAT